jgi:undecaprenyl-diphosphatase
MMAWWQGVLLGLVQGMTEFLPVSSSGHLVIAEQVLGIRRGGVAFEVALHVATLGAVLVVYGGRIGNVLRGLTKGEESAWRYLGLLVIATIPAGLAGVLLGDWFERAFDSLAAVGIDLMATGALLWSTRWASPRPGGEQPSWGGAAAIGLAQAFAILPGISRSGSTVTAALWAGVSPARAAEFSFLMSIPVIAGAAVLEVPKLNTGAEPVSGGVVVMAMLAALVSGILAIKVLVRLLQRGAFYRFAPYCWAVGLATLWWAVSR